jgi:hypothetical protein
VIIKNRIESKDQKPKLALRKETLRQLTYGQLRQVAGGVTNQPGWRPTKTITCNFCH